MPCKPVPNDPSHLSQSVWIAFQPQTHTGKVRPSDSDRKEVRAAVARHNHAAKRAAARAAKKSTANDNDQYVRSRSRTPTEQLLKNRKMSGHASRSLLWTRMILHADLSAIALFLTSTQTNLLGVDGKQGPFNSCALIMHGQALRCMQKSSNMRVQGIAQDMYSSFDMCLGIMAAWEKIHGNATAYMIHVKALRSLTGIHIDEIFDQQEEQDNLDLLDSVIFAVRDRFDHLSEVITYSGRLTVPNEVDTMKTHRRAERASRTPDYSVFNLERAETKTLLLLLDRLADYNLMSSNAWIALHELCLLIFAWRPKKKPPSDWQVLLSREDLEDLALYHMRAGMLSVLGAWTYGVAIASQHDGYFRASDSMDEHYREMAWLATDTLIGTDFEEAAFWSIFINTATATPTIWRPQSLETLRRLIRSPRIMVDSFEDLEALLRRYAYREAVHKQICFALYQTVVAGIEPEQGVGLRWVKVTLADLAM